jgi:hypothetical protein
MTFPMTLDRCQRTLSLVVMTAVPLAAVTMLLATRRWEPALLAFVATSAALAAAAAFAPRAVEVEGRQLRVLRRGAAPVQISVDEVLSVDEGPDCCDLKLFGSSGFLGSFGLFWTLGFGSHWRYATRRGRSVAVRRRRGLPLVLVVDDLPGLRAALLEWWRQGVRA